MALSIATNTASLMAAASASSVNKDMETSMERLSTGKRINSAKDDAAGVAIASRLTSEIRGTNQAIRNAQDGQGLINTAEGAHKEVENILQRMRELAVQASNDTNDTSDRANIQVEMDHLGTEINRIATSTSWAGQSLLNGTSGSALATSSSDVKALSLQIGSSTLGANSLQFNIGAVTTQALGLSGSEGSAPAMSNLSSVQAAGSSSIGQLSVDGNKIALDGPWVAADSFTVDINEQTVTVTLSATDSYTDDEAGFSAQLKDLILADATLSQYVSVTDNGDGSVAISQAATPLIDNLGTTSGPLGSDNEGLSASGNTISFSGDVQTGDAWSFNVNGTAITVTASDTDGFAETQIGLAAQAKNVIEANANLQGIVSVTDNGDGTISLSQSTTPLVDAVTKAAGSAADPAIVYAAAAGTFSFTNAIYEDGATYGSTVNGTEVSITTSADDGFADSVTGIASQFAQAINSAGIEGMTATSALGVVTLVPTVTTSNAQITSDSGTLETSIATTTGGQTSATVTLTSTDDLLEVGDTLAFNVQGTDFSIVVGDDGFENTMAGVSQQMKSVVDEAGLTGVTVAATSTTTGRKAEISVAVDINLVSVLGEEFSVTDGTNTFAYTTIANNESFDTILAGLQGAAAYGTQAATAGGFTMSAGADGASFDLAYNNVGAQTAVTLTSDSGTHAGPLVATGNFTVNGIANGGSNTSILTITNVPEVSSTGVGGDGVDVTLDGQTLSLSGTVGAGDNISFTLGNTAVSVTAFNSSLSDTAEMLVSAITQNSGGSIIASLNDDGSIAVSQRSGSSSVMSSEAAGAAMENIDAAISSLNIQRANLGAISNRLDSTVSNLSNVAINLEGGRGRIEDADFAAESTSLAKSQILQQASTAMLAQANASKQNVLSLLQG
jgi:flagellin